MVLLCLFHVLISPLHSAAGHIFADLHFADEAPIEELFSFYILHQLQIQLSFGFSLHAWAMPLHSSQATWPHFHLLYTLPCIYVQ